MVVGIINGTCDTHQESGIVFPEMIADIAVGSGAHVVIDHAAVDPRLEGIHAALQGAGIGRAGDKIILPLAAFQRVDIAGGGSIKEILEREARQIHDAVGNIDPGSHQGRDGLVPQLGKTFRHRKAVTLQQGNIAENAADREIVGQQVEGTVDVHLVQAGRIVQIGHGIFGKVDQMLLLQGVVPDLRGVVDIGQVVAFQLALHVSRGIAAVVGLDLQLDLRVFLVDQFHQLGVVAVGVHNGDGLMGSGSGRGAGCRRRSRTAA